MVEERGKPPVVVLSGIRWDFLWQHHQILSTLFARAGYPTIYVETTGLSTPSLVDPGTLRKMLRRVLVSGGGGRKEPDTPLNLTLYSPLVAPPTWNVFRRINDALFVPRVARDLRRLLGGVSPIVVAYPPTRTTLDLLAELKPRLTLYDCSDNYEGFPGVPRDIAQTERELLEEADLVSCTSAFLLKKVRSVRPDAFLRGPAVDYERFAALQGSVRVGGPVRTVCFFGHIGEERVDFSVLRRLAEEGFKVRLVGGVGRVEEGFFDLPGVDYRGEVSHAELPAALRGTDAFVIPYQINAQTLGISPMKTYECLATGIPVVATPLPELERLGEHVYLAEGPEDIAKTLRRLPETETAERVRARIELARRNSWEARFEDLEGRIHQELQPDSGAKPPTEERVDILGVGVDPVGVAQLHARMLSIVREGGHAPVLNVNAHALNLCYRDPALRAFFDAASVVFCDGAGVRLAARILGRRLPERITYADWTWQLAGFAESEGLSMFFLGARPGVAKRAAHKLLARYPGLKVAGVHHGHFDHESSENEAVIEEVNAARPDILLVAFGMPLQERWLMRNWDRVDAYVALTGGAVFDYVSGELERGPRLLTDNGFEWLARLLVEPGRLWRRYVVGNPLFLLRVLKQRLYQSGTRVRRGP